MVVGRYAEVHTSYSIQQALFYIDMSETRNSSNKVWLKSRLPHFKNIYEMVYGVLHGKFPFVA
jgi:hypothetical protein